MMPESAPNAFMEKPPTNEGNITPAGNAFLRKSLLFIMDGLS
jgi:hypothetical protein